MTRAAVHKLAVDGEITKFEIRNNLQIRNSNDPSREA